MTISYNWLKDYISCDLTPEQVCAALTSIGLEVDSLEKTEEIPGGLKGVIVAEVLECVEHPDSDHLHVTKLNTGSGEPLQVVCGAPNVAAGQKVLLATVGTVLGEDFKIKVSKIRGVESNGMICAEDELGIGTDHAGIMVLSPDAVPGTAAKDYLHLAEDYIIEIGLTANRVDAASHIGVARDLYAYLKLRDIPCSLNIPSVDAFKEGAGKAMPIEVLAPADAPRYSGITLKDVKVGPSPDFIAKRLQAIGHKPINNIVDITNFVLFEIGQPLHAFDASKVKGGKVIVRRAVKDEPFTTLDGVARKLYDTDLVIANAEAPMCLAGVFGGLESGTTEASTEIFLESAYFNPVTIRKTSKLHTLKTDASFRYERGADPLVTEWAGKRAAILMQEYAGAKVVGSFEKAYAPDAPSKKTIELDYDRIEAFIGKKIGHDVIEKILTYLQYEFISRTATGAVVAAPSYMIDVYRECDVVEEILRIYGYNNIELPSAVHTSLNATPSEKPEPEYVRNIISDFLASNGFNETMNNSLTKGDYYTDCKAFPAEKCVKILNPLSSDLNVMRQSLIFSGLEVIAYNLNHQVPFIKTFEYGSVYAIKPDSDINDHSSYEEHTCFSLFLCGPSEKSWRLPAEDGKSNYYILKGYVELLLRRLGSDIQLLQTQPAPEDIFAEGLSYLLPGSGDVVVTLGTIAPKLAKRFGIKQPVVAAEISWPVLYKLLKRTTVKYKELPKFPEVRRDLALLVDESVTYSELRIAAIKAGKKVVKSVGLFDVYRGDKIPGDKKQYALSFVLQDAEKTLTDAEVDSIMNKILSSLQAQYKVTLR
ncbi:MAG: phenylalanine--tRNA ligase subunit beta [Bacteroidales bacterium]|nr:phenylalanine--tRNA ligase subunit beta [Bacteroidales bacterium]